jgi:glycosyltransferase involved in cell wall biosynthesis
MYECSLIIAFYNKIDYLKLVLAGLERQTFTNFEIIIADDGSKEEIVSELKKIIETSSLTIRHIWHEDKGWRKNEILNKAVLIAHAPYLVFIDGDCIPHRDFIKEHIELSEENVCLTGRRVNLGQKITIGLTPQKVKNGWLEKNYITMLFHSFFRESNIEKGVYIRNRNLRVFLNKEKRGILGSNFSLPKDILLKINGFDERYKTTGYGEDSDVQFRLELIGVVIKSLNYIALQYHLYHKELPRPQSGYDLLNQVKTEKEAFTRFGIQKLEYS